MTAPVVSGENTSPRLWPVLVADLADDAARDFLTGIALQRGRVFVPLLTPPANKLGHKLEVYTPGHSTPLVFHAEPLGAPAATGFPLRLSIWDPSAPAPAQTVTGEIAKSEPKLRAKTETQHQLSPRHTRELSKRKDSATEIEPLTGRAIASGKLQIHSLIGAGGVGSVYKAFHRDLRIAVAVKVLHEDFQNDIEFCRRFHAEALAASRLDHPNLMRVLDFGQEPDGMLYLAMEHLAGKSLVDDVGKPMETSRLLNIMVQVTAGLAHAHARGIVHRDVKPDNIVLVPSRDDDDRPMDLAKVCDFGIAVLTDDGASGTIVGTPEYMSPEQCAGMKNLDGRSDVYACGVILFELATGQLPFNAPTPVKLLNRHMNMPAPEPRSINPNVPEALERIIMKALEKEPEDRQGSMRELRQELRDLARQLESQPRLPVPAPASKRETPPVPARPDWLTDSAVHDRAPAPAPKAPGYELADELVLRPAPWLASFARETRRDAFEALAARLEWAIPALIDGRQLKALFAIRSTLDALDVTEAWRATVVRNAQRLMEEPALLGSLAELVLASDNPPREERELLLRAKVAGSYALYSTRLKLAGQAGVRGRFADLVRLFGADALPMIRAGLAKLETRRDHAVANELARDLLEGAPVVRDEAAGAILARYLHGGSSPELTASCLVGLVRFWGERARPFVVAALDTRDELARAAGLRGLQELGGNFGDRIAVKVSGAMKRTISSEMRAIAADLIAKKT